MKRMVAIALTAIGLAALGSDLDAARPIGFSHSQVCTLGEFKTANLGIDNSETIAISVKSEEELSPNFYWNEYVQSSLQSVETFKLSIQSRTEEVKDSIRESWAKLEKGIQNNEFFVSKPNITPDAIVESVAHAFNTAKMPNESDFYNASHFALNNLSNAFSVLENAANSFANSNWESDLAAHPSRAQEQIELPSAIEEIQAPAPPAQSLTAELPKFIAYNVSGKIFIVPAPPAQSVTAELPKLIAYKVNGRTIIVPALPQWFHISQDNADAAIEQENQLAFESTLALARTWLVKITESFANWTKIELASESDPASR